MSITWMQLPRAAGAIAVVALLAGCVTLPEDRGFGTVAEVARERLGKEVRWQRTEEDRAAVERRVDELLAKPLGAEDAVQLALLNNRGLQAAFHELGIGGADLVQAGRFPNPHFSMFNASRVEGGVREFKIEQALTFNLLALLTIPRALEEERRRFERAQRLVAMETVQLAAQARRAWVQAVAAGENARYAKQVMASADAGAELARRMAQVGNWSQLDRAREQSYYADAALGVARAEQAATAARERLTRVLGLWGSRTTYALPERLPDLPKSPEEPADIERTALERRLDLRAARLETEALAQRLGLTRVTGLVDVFEFGPARVKEGTREDPYKYGYELSFKLPLFDWGQARESRAESMYLQAVERAAQAAIDARSEVREAYLGYRAAWDIARHYREEIVPLRKRIGEETLLRYNGMLIGVFDLLADARMQAVSVAGYIDALRDFWLAQADLAMAMTGKPALGEPAKGGATMAPAAPGGH